MRCGGDCRRPLGHRGDCRPTYFSAPTCDAILRNIGEPCARHIGHRYDHRSRAALDKAASK